MKITVYYSVCDEFEVPDEEVREAFNCECESNYEKGCKFNDLARKYSPALYEATEMLESEIRAVYDSDEDDESLPEILWED
jgi:hypothetical protein